MDYQDTKQLLQPYFIF